MRSTTICLLFVSFCGMSGCGTRTEDRVLADVGGTRITVSQLRDFGQRLPEELRTEKPGFEGYMDHLQTLIDKEILVREARKRGLGNDPELRRRLDQERIDLVVRAFLNKEITNKIVIDDRELRDYQVKTGRNRAVKVRKIIVKTQNEAEEIVRAIKAGGDFAELARRRSIDTLTASRGGVIKGYATKGDMPPLFQEKVFPLHEGEISQPVKLPNGYYGIFQVTEEKPVKLETVRNVLEAELMQEKFAVMMEALIERLQKDLDLRPNYEGLRLLVERMRQGGVNLSDAERKTILYQFAGGKVTLKDVVDMTQDLKIGFSGDDQGRILSFAAQVVMPRALLLEAAHRAGIDHEKEIVARLRRREEALLMLTLRRTAISDNVFVDEDEGRRYYDQHPEVFAVLDTTRGTGPDPFQKVKKRAIALVRRQKEARMFNRFLSELRRQYEPRITIYKDNIEALSREKNEQSSTKR